jgi:hypothetical protein
LALCCSFQLYTMTVQESTASRSYFPLFFPSHSKSLRLQSTDVYISIKMKHPRRTPQWSKVVKFEKVPLPVQFDDLVNRLTAKGTHLRTTCACLCPCMAGYPSPQAFVSRSEPTPIRMVVTPGESSFRSDVSMTSRINMYATFSHESPRYPIETTEKRRLFLALLAASCLSSDSPADLSQFRRALRSGDRRSGWCKN